MKSILISIKPEHCCNILNKDKILEIRTACPTEWKKYLDGKTSIKPEPCKVYIYCTKGKNYKESLYLADDNKYDIDYYIPSDDNFVLNGKVVSGFILNEIDKIEICDPYIFRNNKQEDWEYFEKNACLTCEEMMEYIGYGEDHDGWDKKYDVGYAWHIDGLKIYDTPKKLSKFKTLPCNKPESACRNCKYLQVINTPYAYESECFVQNGKTLTRPPQSWCYVESLE